MKKLNNIVVSKSEVQDKSSLWLQPNNSGSTELKYFDSKGWSSVSSGVKNNYAIESIAASMDVPIERKVTQIVKLQLLNGLYAEVSKFSMNNLKNWTPWYNVALYGQVAQASQ